MALDGKTWVKYSVSVWSDIRKDNEGRKWGHPAVFPIALVEKLLSCYLWETGVVLDPFLGIGTTLVAACKHGHSGVGFDINKNYCKAALQRLQENIFTPQIHFLEGTPQKINIDPQQQEIFIVADDARRIPYYLPEKSIDVVITSPPYWSAMNFRKTILGGQPTPYSQDLQDIGNIDNYFDFVDNLASILTNLKPILKEDSPLIVVVADVRCGKAIYPLPADLVVKLRDGGFYLQDNFIWDRRLDYNNVAPLGYPKKFLSFRTHEHILVFKKEE